MALRWEWSDKLGEVKVIRKAGEETFEFTNIIYRGNAYAIFINHFKQDGEGYYNMHAFFCDKEHAKRMLGLDKKHKDTYGRNAMDDSIDHYTEWTLDRNRKEARELAKLIMDA